MATWYVRHRVGEDKSGKKRRNDSFIHYYLCAKRQKDWKGSDHKNCASANKAEKWVLDCLSNLFTSDALLDAILEFVFQNARANLGPV